MRNPTRKSDCTFSHPWRTKKASPQVSEATPVSAVNSVKHYRTPASCCTRYAVSTEVPSLSSLMIEVLSPQLSFCQSHRADYKNINFVPSSGTLVILYGPPLRCLRMALSKLSRELWPWETACASEPTKSTTGLLVTSKLKGLDRDHSREEVGGIFRMVSKRSAIYNLDNNFFI